MKKVFVTVGMLLVAAPQLIHALELSLQPRVKTGAMYYEFNQKALAEFSSGPLTDPLSAFPNAISELTLRDTLPFFSGGLTLFVERFFIDFDVQHAFNGQDNGRFRSSTLIPEGTLPVVATDAVAQTDILIDSDFNRTEFAVSIGYGITEHLVLYAGYKRTDTDFDQNLRGDIALLPPNNLAPIPDLTGTFTGVLDFEFEYDGPFAGAAYTLEIGKGIFNGALSGNIGLAFLSGNTNLRFKEFVLTNLTGTATPLDLSGLDRQPIGLSNLDGDTVGLSLGLTWKGFTALNGLTYSVGITGYRYDFESDQTQDFTETLVRFDVGLAYALDF